MEPSPDITGLQAGEDLRRLAAVLRRVIGAPLTAGSVQCWLFGSHARSQAQPHSDIDIALAGEVSRQTLAQLREEIEESQVRCRVDVVDLQSASPAIRQAVAKEGVRWPI